MLEIHQRGHTIGIHPSYRAHCELIQLQSEVNALRQTLDDLAIHQDELGGRHHFLRWDAGHSPGIWDAAGLAYDSSISFAEEPGFRSGVCYSYPMFDLLGRHTLRVRERPLIIMDASMTSRQYMGLNPDSDQARQTVSRLKKQCVRFGGEFTILWHNHVLADRDQFSLYKYAITS